MYSDEMPLAARAPTTAPAEDLSFTDELARTGIGPEHLVLAATSVLLVTTGALLLARRRR